MLILACIQIYTLPAAQYDLDIHPLALLPLRMSSLVEGSHGELALLLKLPIMKPATVQSV
jgi:hypothetical protein